MICSIRVSRALSTQQLLKSAQKHECSDERTCEAKAGWRVACPVKALHVAFCQPFLHRHSLVVPQEDNFSTDIIFQYIYAGYRYMTVAFLSFTLVCRDITWQCTTMAVGRFSAFLLRHLKL